MELQGVEFKDLVLGGKYVMKPYPDILFFMECVRLDKSDAGFDVLGVSYIKQPRPEGSWANDVNIYRYEWEPRYIQEAPIDMEQHIWNSGNTQESSQPP